jgi:energy-coupling factor transporter ATP-binding protein EcfA2
MRISGLRMTNFKRFTDLTIEGIGQDTKLVLLIGANGSGKSSVFDAFEFVSRNAKRGSIQPQGEYYRKSLSSDASVRIDVLPRILDDSLMGEINVVERIGDIHGPNLRASQFYGRSSIRIIPRATAVSSPEAQLLRDADGPSEFILPDERFNADLQLYVSGIDEALREAFIAEKRNDAPEVRSEQIEPLNKALVRVFGDKPGLAPQLVNWRSTTVGTGAQLIFSKGEVRITYDLLSHGEKQVVILLLDFLVRRDQMQDHVIFIDEMDNHLHRDLQFRLLEEIVDHWIPDSSQLWTATHALGFIDYASKAPEAVVIDLDELDFDQPQILRPLKKNDPSMFDIAISPQLLAELAANRRIVFVEGKTDIGAFNSIGGDVIFLPAGNKNEAFFKARGANMLCLIDGDLLTNDDKLGLRKLYPFVRFLPTYCLENELYHPDNIAELAARQSRDFDREAYVGAWVSEMGRVRNERLAKVRSTRSSYKSMFIEIEKPPFAERDAQVVADLNSEDFETFYPLLSAKDNGREACGLVSWATRSALAGTERFAQRIKESLS